MLSAIWQPFCLSLVNAIVHCLTCLWIPARSLLTRAQALVLVSRRTGGRRVVMACLHLQAGQLHWLKCSGSGGLLWDQISTSRVESCHDAVISLWPSDTIWQHRIDLVNTGSGNSLLPDGTKPFPEPMMTSHQWGSVAFTLKQIYRDSQNNYLLQ